MEPFLVLEPIPSNPSQGFPYLYLEPGIPEPGFVKVYITIEKMDTAITFENVGQC